MAGTYQRLDIYITSTEVDRGGGIFEDGLQLFKSGHPVRFSRRKHRIDREKQGIDDEDVWDVYIEPEDLEEREDYYFHRPDTGMWYECLNFRAQRTETGRLHHWTSKVKQIPPPTVPIITP